ncbi:MAG TPA: PDZ domain-containing protein [Planctomycetaceae bacterium]|nr:PDZ domain-containing protein [Planctomycetaceae bacterium]
MYRRFRSAGLAALAAVLFVTPAAAAAEFDGPVEAPRPGRSGGPVGAPRPLELQIAPEHEGPVPAPRPKLADRVRPIVVRPQQVPGLIGLLDSDHYRDRQQATRLLKAAGAAAVGPLAGIAEHGSLEAAVRAVRILQAIYISGDDAGVDAAEAALEQLQRSPHPWVAARAEAVLVMNYDVRERRAVEEIARLGGGIQYTEHPFPDQRFPEMLRFQVQAVILGKDWRGGEDGLKYVRRLEQLPMLYVIDGTGALSPTAEQQLLADLPNLRIEHRSRACLGVGGNTGVDGCLVSQVKSGSAADRGGVQVGDVITRFGGKDVSDFASMVKIIYDYEPGNRVAIEVNRRGRPLELEVVMDGWTDLESRPRPTELQLP